MCFLHNLFIRLDSGAEIALGSSISAASFTNCNTVAFYTGDQQFDFMFLSVSSWASQNTNWTPYLYLSLLIQNVQLGTYLEPVSVALPCYCIVNDFWIVRAYMFKIQKALAHWN